MVKSPHDAPITLSRRARLSDTDKWSPRLKVGLVTFTILLYAALYLALYPRVGSGIGAFSAVPMAVAAWLYGLRFALYLWVLSLPLHTLLANLSGVQGLDALVRVKGIPGHIALLFVALAVGWMRHLNHAAKRELAERKKAEHALRETETRYRLVAQATNDAVWDWDLLTDAILWNNGVRSLFGYHPDQIGPDSAWWKAHIHPDDRERVVSSIQRIIEGGGQNWTAEYRFAHADGSYKPVIDRGFIVLDEDGKPVRMIGSMMDLSALKAAEISLRASEARFRAMNEASPLGIFMTDAQGDSIYANATTLRISDRGPGEIEGRAWVETIHPDDRQMVVDKWQAALDSQSSYENEYRLLHRDGRIVWTSVKAAPIRDGETLLGYVGTVEDITARKQAQEALKAERNLLRTVIDNLPDYIFVKDREGRFLLSNLAHALAAGFSVPEQVIGKLGSEVFPVEVASQFAMDDETVLQQGQPLVNVERQTVDASGRQRWVLTTKVPLQDESGQITGLVGISRDITDRKNADARLLELGLERERVRLLERFIGDASHDLRTPLTIMRTSLHLLERQPDPERRQRHIERLNGEVDRLAYLLEQMLTVSWLDRTTLEFDEGRHDLNTLAQEIVSEQAGAALHRNLRLEFAPDFEIPDIRMNRDELKRAIGHLLDNALHYTPEYGSVLVATGRRGDQVMVEVRDSGMGITPEELPLIFERFYRADKARSAKTGGMGLGLPIAKRIVEAHGGTITVESVPGAGSIFRILLPA